MEYQLTALTLQEMPLKRELATYSQVVKLTALNDWELAARGFFLDLQAGLDTLSIAPENDEEKEEVFEIKRGIIKALINRVTIENRRELRVEIKLNVLEMLEQAAKRDFT